MRVPSWRDLDHAEREIDSRKHDDLSDEELMTLFRAKVKEYIALVADYPDEFSDWNRRVVSIYKRIPAWLEDLTDAEREFLAANT